MFIRLTLYSCISHVRAARDISSAHSKPVSTRGGPVVTGKIVVRAKGVRAGLNNVCCSIDGREVGGRAAVVIQASLLASETVARAKCVSSCSTSAYEICPY
jgi:hypothetical protein